MSVAKAYPWPPPAGAPREEWDAWEAAFLRSWDVEQARRRLVVLVVQVVAFWAALLLTAVVP